MAASRAFRPPEREGRLPFIDAAKGLAVGLVVLYHLEIYKILPAADRLWPLHAADLGVDVFMILSALGLTYSAIHHPSRLAGREWFRRRMRRVALPYAMALAAKVGIDYAVFRVTYSAGDLATHWFCLHGLWPAFLHSVCPPWWFLTAILLAYLLYHPLLAATRRLGETRTFFLALAVGLALNALQFAWGIRHHPSFHLISTRLLVFAAAVPLAHTWLRRGGPGRVPAPTRLLAVAGASGAASLALWLTAVRTDLEPAKFASYPFAAFVLLLVLAYVRIGPFERLLSRVGAISYEVFLVHAPILLWFPFTKTWRFPLDLAAALGLVVLAALVLRSLSRRVIAVVFPGT